MAKKSLIKPKIYDPLFSDTASLGENSLITAAVSDVAQYRQPISPISNQPMEKILVGAYGQAPFYAWVHLQDRIVLPYRGE